MRRGSNNPEERRYQTAGLSIDLQLESCLQNYCAGRFLAPSALHNYLHESAPQSKPGPLATLCLRNAR